MKIDNGFSPEFLEGFVEQCQRMGMDANGTEELFRKHANNTILAQANINEGFNEVIGRYKGRLTKAALVRWLTPDHLSLATECRIKWGSDPLAQQMRAAMNWPEPSWETVPEPIKEAAASLSHMMSQFDYLPMNQKVMLAALLGGGAGSLYRTVHPTADDKMNDRGVINRATRGLASGGALGAGAGAGLSLMSGDLDPTKPHTPMKLASAESGGNMGGGASGGGGGGGSMPGPGAMAGAGSMPSAGASASAPVAPSAGPASGAAPMGASGGRMGVGMNLLRPGSGMLRGMSKMRGMGTPPKVTSQLAPSAPTLNPVTAATNTPSSGGLSATLGRVARMGFHLR